TDGVEAMRAVLLAVIVGALAAANAFPAEPGSRFVTGGRDGKLAYEADARGNRIPDFLPCGGRGGGEAAADVPIRVVVPPRPGDSGSRIQAAIDHVCALKPDADGFRGAVLLLAGRHEVSGSLRIATSGVVLRGQGRGRDGTVLVATGTDRRT